MVVVGFAPEEHVFPSSSRPKGIIAAVQRCGEWKGWKEKRRRQGRRVSIMAP